MSMNLYRRRRFLTSVCVLLSCMLAFSAVQAQRRTPHKLRATAVLETTTDSSGVAVTRVFPVTILDEGRFRDAAVYKATPRPMALDNGIVYEAQRSGIPAGYVTVVNGVNHDGWTALGKWQNITVAKKTEAPAPPAEPGSDRPILHRGGESSASSPAAASSTPAATPAATPVPAASPTPDQAATQNPAVSEPEDADRPVLRRRTPDKAEPAVTASATPSAPAATPTPTPAARHAGPREPMAVNKAATRTYVGVSDNQPLDVRSYDFVWKRGERQEMEDKLLKLALAQLPRENSQITVNSLKNVDIRSFDLDLSNDAVMVLTAEIPGSYLAATGKAGAARFVSRYLTLIARVDFEGEPQKLAASVTDSSRLDVAPRLELIDAVDVDGDGLAELLFREYNFDQVSFIVYGVGRGSVTKVFEGASQPLK
ncbi:MAG TPA: hypothetical protein VFT65_14140 [Candidatus Angelobacter sp.]|nr:hypothetical protein [Candidatus Angelobacter sp.]